LIKWSPPVHRLRLWWTNVHSNIIRGIILSLMPALLSVENWVPLKPVLGGVSDVALIYYPSCTDLIKPSLQFLCYFVVIIASEGSLCFQILIDLPPTVYIMEAWWWTKVQSLKSNVVSLVKNMINKINKERRRSMNATPIWADTRGGGIG
jgi:hypothetical protein